MCGLQQVRRLYRKARPNGVPELRWTVRGPRRARREALTVFPPEPCKAGYKTKFGPTPSEDRQQPGMSAAARDRSCAVSLAASGCQSARGARHDVRDIVIQAVGAVIIAAICRPLPWSAGVGGAQRAALRARRAERAGPLSVVAGASLR